MSYLFTPSILLALIDFIPVVLFAVGCYFLLKYAYRNTSKGFFALMLIGVLITFTRGMSKATWKILYAITNNNITPFNNSQMYLLATGTTMIFISVISIFVRHKKAKKTSTMLSLPFFVPVICILTASTIGYLALLSIISFDKKHKKAGTAFLIYLAIGLFMAGASSLGEYEIVHWICEFVNILGSCTLIYGTYHLNKLDKEQSANKSLAA